MRAKEDQRVPRWLYSGREGKIFTTVEEIKAALANGWTESPCDDAPRPSDPEADLDALLAESREPVSASKRSNVDFSALNVRELRAYAREHGIQLPAIASTRDAIIELLSK